MERGSPPSSKREALLSVGKGNLGSHELKEEKQPMTKGNLNLIDEERLGNLKYPYKTREDSFGVG